MSDYITKRLLGLFPFGTAGKFGAVGVLTTLLDIVLFSSLVHLVGLGPAISNAISYGSMVILSFVLNRNWTFHGREDAQPAMREGAKFAATHFVSLCLSTLLVSLLALILAATVAKVISVPIVLIWNYLAARHWVFKTQG